MLLSALVSLSAAPTKSEGSSVEFDTAAEQWTARYVHETVALAFAITEEAVEDNLYDTLSKRYTAALARSMAYTKQVKAASVLNKGFTGTGNPTYGDGKVLFATDHPYYCPHGRPIIMQLSLEELDKRFERI